MLDRLIASSALVSGHALSFEQQPYFRGLIDLLRERRKPLVIITGAGLSMDAGLPSWPQLLKHLEKQLVSEDRRRAFGALDPTTLERLTDTLLMLTGSANSTQGNSHNLARALYGDTTNPSPGSLALAVARLVQAYRRRVSLVTTNFDQVLEGAIQQVTGVQDVRGFSFEGWEDWQALDDEEHSRSVLHLHGIVYSETRTPEGPLVLSESDFNKHGPAIQKALGAICRDAHVITIGASLNDRNITTALADSCSSGLTSDPAPSEARSDHYSLVTPPLTKPGLTTVACAEAAVWNAEVVESTVGLRPILLKSFGQVSQAVTELALAAKCPRRYQKPRSGLPKSESLHYGTRFVTTLKEVYSSLGRSSASGGARIEDRMALSLLMHDLVEGKDGPAQVLRALRRAYGLPPTAEKIGVFLWLRQIPTRANHDEVGATDTSDFVLTLISSSVYVHWDEWSAARTVAISATSANAAAQAAFGGNAVFKDIAIEQHSGHWQGAWAKPLIVFRPLEGEPEDASPYNQLQIGAVAVNTTLRVSLENESEDPRSLSGLAQFKQADMEVFEASVDNVIDALLR